MTERPVIWRGISAIRLKNLIRDINDYEQNIDPLLFELYESVKEKYGESEISSGWQHWRDWYFLYAFDPTTVSLLPAPLRSFESYCLESLKLSKEVAEEAMKISENLECQVNAYWRRVNELGYTVVNNKILNERLNFNMLSSESYNL